VSERPTSGNTSARIRSHNASHAGVRPPTHHLAVTVIPCTESGRLSVSANMRKRLRHSLSQERWSLSAGPSIGICCVAGLARPDREFYIESLATREGLNGQAAIRLRDERLTGSQGVIDRLQQPSYLSLR
jgi:hypothetical protein